MHNNHSRGHRVLILTGKLCADKIRESTECLNTHVMELPIDVASLMTANLIRSELEGKDLSGYDYILLPGLFRDNLEELEREFATSFYLGPIHSSDIKTTLETLGEDRLSKNSPANAVMEELLRKRTLDTFEKANVIPDDLPPSTVLIGTGKARLAVGKDFPPKILAEIVDAPRKDVYSILLEARRFVCSGASIIDVGMIPGHDNSEFIGMIVPLLKRDLNVPVSVDTLQEQEILAAANARADLILSISGQTIDIVPSIDSTIVLIPVRTPVEERPRSARGKLELLAEYSSTVQRDNVVVDPLLEPIGLGFMESIRAYLDLPSVIPNRPALMGVGNVIELTDADSIGLNALLAAVACETGTGLLLTTENSPKTRGSVEELATACKMMFYSCKRGFLPKNLGINLLRYKEKTHRGYPLRLPRVKIQASHGLGVNRNAVVGKDRFHVALHKSQIHTICYLKDREIDIIGRSAQDIAEELYRRDLIPDPVHALYLGSELIKAQIALRTGRSYIQDEPLFREDESRDERSDD